MNFQRIQGPQADVNEIEYVAALHQTCMPHTRANGTVSSIDVQALLASRYGIRLGHAECIAIVRGLGGYLIEDTGGRNQNQSDQANLSTDTIRILGKKPLVYQMAMERMKKIYVGENRGDNTRSDIDSDRTGDATRTSTLVPAGQSIKFSQSATSQKPHPDHQTSTRPAITSLSSNVKDYEIPEEYLDLVQLLSILIIPCLASCARDTIIRRGGNESGAPLETPAKVEHVIEHVYQVLIQQMLYQDDIVLTTGPILDSSLVEAILLECGEYELSQNEALIVEMIEAANSSSGRLDVNAFCHALTSDLDLWPIGSEQSVTTFFQDVFGVDRGTQYEQRQTKKQEDPESNTHEKGVIDADKKLPDLSSVDFVVDTHASVTCVALIWFFYIMVSVTYASLFQAVIKPTCDTSEFGCLLAFQLWNW